MSLLKTLTWLHCSISVERTKKRKITQSDLRAAMQPSFTNHVLSLLDCYKNVFVLLQGRRVKPGAIYKFIGWTKLLDPKKTGDLHSLELWIKLRKRRSKKRNKMLLAKRSHDSNGMKYFIFYTFMVENHVEPCWRPISREESFTKSQIQYKDSLIALIYL